MALRLIDTPSGPDASVIASRAGVCLRTNDLAGYRALFAQAAEIDDADRRYQARKQLLTLALESADQRPAAQLPPLYLALAQSALEVLAAEPSEPSLLNLAGVALYELWELGGAEALFRAARRLDPDLPFVERNLSEIQRRKRAGAAAMRMPKPIAVALPALARDAKAIADRARPAEGMTLTLAMIVRDEQEMLPRCLAAARPYVDELIVVDTGSVDRTREIAAEHGATVVDFTWTGSFADARNVSFEHATGDWVMFLDADEVLVADDGGRLRELLGQTWREAFYLVETNFTGDLEDGTAVTHNALRLFRNRPGLRFEGRIHEQISQSLPTFLPERFGHSAVRVEHYGYLGAVRDAKEKSRRNVELLTRQLDEGGETPFLRFNLGSEHLAAGDNEAAVCELERAWEMLSTDPARAGYGYAPSLIGRLVKALRACGRAAEAQERAAEGLALFPGFTDLVLEQAYAARDLGARDRAITLLEQCVEMGDAPTRYTATAGCGTYLALAALAEQHRQRGDTDRSLALLRRCAAEHPSFVGVALPLAAALLQTGSEPAQAVAEVLATIDDTPTVRFMLGAALYEAGHAAAAEEQLRDVLRRQPDTATARLALAEALLSQRRWPEAALAAAAVPAEAGCAPAAARTEAFAALAAGDHVLALESIARARSRGSDAADVAVLEAWAALALGRDLPRLTPASAPFLFTVLEALLRVEEIDTFAQLEALTARLGISSRERREQLASIYLRRGYLQSAADEWIASCEDDGVDADALVGLAQVALAQGLHEDAAVFAAEAAELDPTHPAARRAVSLLAAP